MARTRSIKPEFYSDTLLADLSITCRYFYIGLFCQLDRQGVTVDDAKLLKREVFPYDDSVTVDAVRNLVDELVNSGRLRKFSHHGRAYLFCPTFKKHQHFHKEEKARYDIPTELLSAPCEHGVSTVSEQFNANAKPPVICNLESVICNPQNEETGDNTKTHSLAEPSASARASAGNNPLLEGTATKEILDRVKRDVQDSWVSLYPDPAWIKSEIGKAWVWCKSNPKRAPRAAWARFLSQWLSRGWEDYRKRPNGLNPPMPALNLVPIDPGSVYE